MDIKKLIDNFKDNDNEINLLIQGLQNSPYYCSNLSINNLFKSLVVLYIELHRHIITNEHREILNTLTGGIRSVISKKKPTKEKPSEDNDGISKIMTFTGDLKISLNNIIGLIGNEFTISIMSIMKLPKTLLETIKAIELAQSYKDIGKLITIIVNIYKLHDGNIFKYNPSGNKEETFNYIEKPINNFISL